MGLHANHESYVIRSLVGDLKLEICGWWSTVPVLITVRTVCNWTIDSTIASYGSRLKFTISVSLLNCIIAFQLRLNYGPLQSKTILDERSNKKDIVQKRGPVIILKIIIIFFLNKKIMKESSFSTTVY